MNEDAFKGISPGLSKAVDAWNEKKKLQGGAKNMQQFVGAVAAAEGKIPGSWLPNNPNASADAELKEMGVMSPFMSVEMKAPPLNMKNATAENAFHRILVIGDSGTGKTHFIGSMPKPYVADFDNGLATLRGKDVSARRYGPEGWADLKKEVQDWRNGPHYDCETFCLDSLTMASDAAMQHVLSARGRHGQQPDIKDWGDAIREVKDLMGFLTTLPCHVLVTAHNQLIKDEVLGDIQYAPLIYGKDLPVRLPIWFDEVYATTVVSKIEGGKTQSKYQLQVKPDQRNKIIKSRMNTDGKLFDMYEEPDFAALVKKTQPKK